MNESFNLKYGENCVYKDDLSLTVENVVSRFVWMGQIFHLIRNDNNIFIPANGEGWKWVLDTRDIGLKRSSLRLYQNEESLSYLALHFDADDGADVPLKYNLTLPEFIDNCVILNIEDSMCRQKKILHPVKHKLEIEKYTITFEELDRKKVKFSICCDKPLSYD
jgi:hypothetical protein